MIEFKRTPAKDDADNSLSIVMRIHNECSYPEAIAAFEGFLRACGYNFDGHLEVINDDESEELE